MNARELLIHNAQYLSDDGMSFVDGVEYFDENQQAWITLVGSCSKALYLRLGNLKLRIKPKKTKKQILIDYLDYFDKNMQLIDGVEFHVKGKWQPASVYYCYHHLSMITDYPVRMNRS